MVVEKSSTEIKRDASKPAGILKSHSRIDGNLSKPSEISLKQSGFKLKSKSHEELEIEIQSSRILFVLDETVKKLEIAAYLPSLVEGKAKILRKFLPPEDVDFIVESCTKYSEVEPLIIGDNKSMTSSNIESIFSTQPKFQEKSLYLKDSKMDINISQAIEMIYSCKTLIKNLGSWDCDADDLSLKFVNGAKRLRQATAQKLSVSALEERDRERDLTKAWKDNAEAKVLIESIQERLDKQSKELEFQLTAKQDLINAYTEKIEALKEKFREDIKQKCLSSEKQMVQNSQISEERQVLLAQQAKDETHNYQVLLDRHLLSEKQLRAKRSRIETQLATWLGKYDTEVGDRQAELEELTRLYEEEMEEMNKLQQKFDEQEVDYVELMAERDEYLQGIYEEEAHVFLMNRAAKIIQRHWKAYLERKAEKKRAKKAKKDKKKQEQAAPKPPPPPKIQIVEATKDDADEVDDNPLELPEDLYD